jgi:hypothetical protein
LSFLGILPIQPLAFFLSFFPTLSISSSFCIFVLYLVYFPFFVISRAAQEHRSILLCGLFPCAILIWWRIFLSPFSLGAVESFR